MLTNSRIYKFINSWIKFDDSLARGSIFIKYMKAASKLLTKFWNSSNLGSLLNSFTDENTINESISIKLFRGPVLSGFNALSCSIGKNAKNAISNSKTICILSRLSTALTKKDGYIKNSYIAKLISEFWSCAD